MTNRFAQSAVIILYIVAGLLPLWFLPAPFGIETGREIAFGALAAVAGILLLTATLAKGEVRYPVSPLLWAAGAVALVWAASTALGATPYVSAFFADAPAEELMTLGAGLALMLIAAGALQRRGEAGVLLFVLIFSGAGAALLSLYTFVIGPIGFLPSAPYFNVIGTINGLALFYAALLMMTAGLLLTPAAQWKRWVRWVLVVSAGLLLTDLVLIHFRTAWIVMLGAGVCLFGLLLTNISKDQPIDLSRRFGWRQWAALGLVLFSIIMIMAPAGMLKTLDVPVEVSPSLSATFAAAGSVFREGPLRVFFGSGPGTFGMDWARYKDASINQTVFWNVRFNQGQSWVATVLPTVGVLGFVALVGFLAAALLIFLRMMLSSSSGGRSAPASGEHRSDALAMSAFLGMLTLLIAAFLYPANASLMLCLFLLAGVLTFLLARPLPEPETAAETAGHGDTDLEMDEDAESPAGDSASDMSPAIPVPIPKYGFWGIRERVVRFETPWVVFASSLSIIFFVALGIAALYGEVGRIRATVAAGRGARAFNEGKIDQAIGAVVRAAALEPHNWRTMQLLVQMRIEQARRIIQRAAGGENVQQEFQSAVSLAIQDSQRLTQAYPYEPTLWRLQGSLYEMVIPFIQGSERFAAESYQRATALEPLNPAAYVDWGRAGLVFTDRIAALAQQAQAKDREELLKARAQNLEQIAQIFPRAIQAKPDYAPAHFLLAQTQIRLGNLDSAIASVENAKLAAPFDIGVAFQLGLLYYQKNDLGKAAAEFQRAVTANENYSNARYFLGLIADRKGDKTKALEEFERIAALNPDNQEVRLVVANLKAGKQALNGIVPPAAPPQERKEVPVSDR